MEGKSGLGLSGKEGNGRLDESPFSESKEGEAWLELFLHV